MNKYHVQYVIVNILDACAYTRNTASQQNEGRLEAIGIAYKLYFALFRDGAKHIGPVRIQGTQFIGGIKVKSWRFNGPL